MFPKKLWQCIRNSCGARTVVQNGWIEHRFAPMDRAKTMEQGEMLRPKRSKKSALTLSSVRALC